MIKKVSILSLSIFAVIFCMSASFPNDNLETAIYVEDGLVLYEEVLLNEEESIEAYKENLDDFVVVKDNQFVIDYDGIINSGFSDANVLEHIKENVSFANELASEQSDMVTINDDKSLSFIVEDEYAEQWNAWQLSWNLWSGWKYKLDSDFGKLIGITGIAYRLMSYLSNGAYFFRNIMSITDKSYLASTLTTLFFYLPGTGVRDNVATYLQNYAGAIASTLVSINLMLMTLKHASVGIGWIIFKVVDFISSRVTPSLITSASMVYNCFRYNAPIYCKISLWTAKISYSLTNF